MKEELKSAFFSKRFLLAFGLMLSCFLGYSLPTWIFSADWGDEFREGALQLSVGGIFFGGSMLLLPFCAGVTYAISQVDEVRTSFLEWKAIRCSTQTYARNKIIATMLSAAAATGLAFALHALVWNFIAYPYDLVAHPYQEIPFSAKCIYSQWTDIFYAFPIYAWMTFGIALCAAVWSVTALAVSVWVPDKLLTIIVPVCIYYLWSCRIFYHLFGISTPHPGALYDDALTVERVWQSLLMYAILLVISIFVYVKGLKRRIQDA